MTPDTVHQSGQTLCEKKRHLSHLHVSKDRIITRRRARRCREEIVNDVKKDDSLREWLMESVGVGEKEYGNDGRSDRRKTSKTMSGAANDMGRSTVWCFCACTMYSYTNKHSATANFGKTLWESSSALLSRSRRSADVCIQYPLWQTLTKISFQQFHSHLVTQKKDLYGDTYNIKWWEWCKHLAQLWV